MDILWSKSKICFDGWVNCFDSTVMTQGKMTRNVCQNIAVIYYLIVQFIRPFLHFFFFFWIMKKHVAIPMISIIKNHYLRFYLSIVSSIRNVLQYQHMQKIIQRLNCVYFILLWMRAHWQWTGKLNHQQYKLLQDGNNQVSIMWHHVPKHCSLPSKFPLEPQSLCGINTFIFGVFKESKRVTECHLVIIKGISIAS